MFHFVYQNEAYSKLDESRGWWPTVRSRLLRSIYRSEISLFDERLKPVPETALPPELSILRKGRMSQNGGRPPFCSPARLADRASH